MRPPSSIISVGQIDSSLKLKRSQSIPIPRNTPHTTRRFTYKSSGHQFRDFTRNLPPDTPQSTLYHLHLRGPLYGINIQPSLVPTRSGTPCSSGAALAEADPQQRQLQLQHRVVADITQSHFHPRPSPCVLSHHYLSIAKALTPTNTGTCILSSPTQVSCQHTLCPSIGFILSPLDLLLETQFYHLDMKAVLYS
ncbi:hypothetical protein BO70DRAFT_363544 [Aspergillus heteromorphus CBS 117.55]|uniref:Uncharacterized protein n=1 Tax=Aspergillus heteromorphus CBS 117.55 TaxID=1448321 RepID=A0A317VYM3_9EURO|nr:uncharacterized protein BO70DRAFT_363544 [Aspergillus heteromorphus CBS 117.55]PWY76990.1 hypothetical protein BO70DRAFT_363544 [Aspergillus heteromorphus CBS 117.55]